MGKKALQSCLPHQLDLRTGQSTLQLHQQRQAARASAHITSSLFLPPDSEIVAPVSIRSSSGKAPNYAASVCSRICRPWGASHTGRTTAVCHDIDTQGARPVRCGPRRLAPVGLLTDQTCIREMLEGGQIEPSEPSFSCGFNFFLLVARGNFMLPDRELAWHFYLPAWLFMLPMCVGTVLV